MNEEEREIYHNGYQLGKERGKLQAKKEFLELIGEWGNKFELTHGNCGNYIDDDDFEELKEEVEGK